MSDNGNNDLNLCSIGSDKDVYVGFANEGLNALMIILSICGICMNVFFSVSYLKKIFKIKKGVSSVETTLLCVSIVETLISICWLLNNSFIQNTRYLKDRCKLCKGIAHTEIFLYIFDWMILSSSLYQIKKIIQNPESLLAPTKSFIKIILICFIISFVNCIFSFFADIGGISPLITCFINILTLHTTAKKVYFWIFFLFPIVCFIFGGIQIYLIMKDPNYKTNKGIFVEYSYFIITYIFFSVLLIICYIYSFIKNYYDGTAGYNAYITATTLFSCASPLIVGLFRGYRTGFIKGLFSKRKKQTNEDNLIDKQEEEGGRMYKVEQQLLETQVLKYYVAISYSLGKSKYENEEDEITKDNENKILDEKVFYSNEKTEYKITKANILKDLDLSINEDIRVLEEANINIDVTEYNSSVFKKLRRLEGLNEDKIISMFQPKKGTSQLIKKIKDSTHINSINKLMVLKQIKKEYLLFYQRNILSGLYEYLKDHPNSMLCRVFGLFKINIDNKEDVYMALMYDVNKALEVEYNLNLLNGNEFRQMKISEAELKRNIVIDSKKSKENKINLTVDVGYVDNSFVLGGNQNNNKTFQINLTDYENDKLLKIMNQDAQFLRAKNIYRYNFLVFERNIENKDRISIFKDDDEKNLDKGKLNSNNTNHLSSYIKKYIFNSNLSNIIYGITIFDFSNINK